ncbi:hypothetical protein [Hyalangium rubrum]|uniref:Uncharacterized protein n=1 Tax=Hyalangium rubrum TaxID=3103134 RepID=A0ABU5GZP9_9BACT|nr:hypothetical protein [Hyalangium sp. s54d21]MDY7226667.1 hypothetical protein [Hyalangium sp. s54d21]
MLERTSAEVTYSLPAEQVMEAARAVLNEQGYVIAPGGGPLSVRTHWKLEGDLDTLTRWSKVLVIGQHQSDGHFVVRAQQVVWVTGGRTAPHPGMGGSSGDAGKRGSDGATHYVQGDPHSASKPVFSRALGVEWEILKHLDPQLAANVEQQVDIYLANNPQSGQLRD